MFKLLKKFKPAITLGELLVVFIIMGVVAGMTIMTAKPADKAYRYIYMRVYNTLGTAFYNSMAKIPNWAVGNANFDGTFPTKSELFCKMLLEYINDTVGDGQANCAAPMVDLTLSKANLDTYLQNHAPHFVANNGVRFWIARNDHSRTVSAMYPNPKDADYGIIRTLTPNAVESDNSFSGSNSDATETRFYTVIADLNGKKGPNTVQWAMNKTPVDIVAFVVTENADVIPLGGPIFDTRYLTARVAYNSTKGTDESDVNTSSSMSLYEAQKRAWATKYKSNPVIGSYTRGAIYPNADEALSLPVIQDQSVVDLNGSFGTGGAAAAKGFGIVNYLMDEKAKSFYDGLKLREFDNTKDSAKPWSQGDCTTESGRFDPEACYVKIDDFN